MGARKCTKELLEELAKRMTASQIAEKLDMNLIHLYKTLKRHGIEPVRVPRNKFQLPKQALTEMYERMTIEEIAQKCKCSPTTIRKELSRHKIKKHPVVRLSQQLEAARISAESRAGKRPHWVRRHIKTNCTTTREVVSVFDLPTYNPNAKGISTRYAR